MNPPSKAPSPGVWKTLGPKALLLTLAACFAVYSPVLTSYFLADDFRLFGWSPSYDQGHFLQTHGKYMRPIPGWTMHWEYRLWGLNPLPPHLSNLALHALVSIQVSALALRLSGPHRSRAFAWAAGLLFAVHPIHTGAVSWLAARYDLCLAAFGLGSVLKLDDFLRTKSRLSLAASVLLLVGALLSKETAVALPGILILWALVQRERGEALPWTVSALMVAMLAAYLAMRIAVFGELSPGARIYPPLASLPYDLFVLPLERLIFPADSSLWAGAWTPIVWILSTLALVTLVAGGFGARAQVRGGDALSGRGILKILVFGFGLHQICMFAMFSVASRLSAPVVPSRLLYLPSAGFCLLLAAGLGSMGARIQRVMLGVWVLAYAVIAIGNNLAWREAGQITRSTLSQLESIVEETPIANPLLLVTELPETLHGAYVLLPGSLRNALSLHVDKTHRLQQVGSGRNATPKDLRTQMPLRQMLALRWDDEMGKLANETSLLRTAVRNYMELPDTPTIWAGKGIQAWTTGAEGFVTDEDGIQGTATTKYVGLRGPAIPISSGVLEIDLDLRSARDVPDGELAQKPRLYVEWPSRGGQSLVRPQRIPLKVGDKQTVRIQCPPAFVLEDLQREGLDVVLLFAVQDHELRISQIRAKKIPKARKRPRKRRRSQRPAHLPQSDALRSPRSARDR